MSTVPTSPIAPDYLINGDEYLAANPGFKLIGRKADLDAVTDVLLRKSAGNNLILTGINGVGLSSFIMGIEASKDDPATPLEMAGKSFLHLDVDALFDTSDTNEIEKRFQQTMATLKSTSDAVLIIDDTKGFLDGVENSNASNIVNLLMRETRTNPHLQTIFVAEDRDLGALQESHSDIAKTFTLQEIAEPPKNELRAILENSAKEMGEQYGVTVTKAALDSITELTAKYPGFTMGMAQPKRSLVILEGALASYSRAQARPAALNDLEETLAAVNDALATGKAPEGDLAGKSREDLESMRVEAENSIEEVKAEWKEQQTEVRSLIDQKHQAEQEIQAFNVAIQDQQGKDAYTKQARADFKAAEGDAAQQEEIKQAYKAKYLEELIVVSNEKKSVKGNFNNLDIYASMADSSGEVGKLEEQRKPFEEQLKAINDNIATLSKADAKGKEMTDTPVLAEFSRLSQLPMNKLKQDESDKLLHLSDTIKARVFGQDEPAEALADAVQRARMGLKKPNKPIGSFLFLGPSGVGKTEMAKALAEALFGDESALQIYNMSEYMEKHASAVLIGAPPGYEGYAEGGILTNNMRRMPYCVNVFDEAEKANKQVFDLFLQILDEGSLTDRRGMKASFANSINIMTSNVGAEYFLDKKMSFEEASEKALNVLWNKDPDTGKPLGEQITDDGQQKGFRPEFLNRFTGIFCFHRLETGQIKLIAAKNIKELNGWLEEKGIQVEMPDKDLTAMCESEDDGGQYDTTNGGRGIMNYIEKTVTTDVAKTLLKTPDERGVARVSYTPQPAGQPKDKAKISTTFVPEGAAQAAPKAAANSNVKNVQKPAVG